MIPTWRRELPQWILLAAMGLASALAWGGTPDRVPVHWNLQGEPDGWAGRAGGLLLLPAIALGVYLLMAFIPRLDPGRANYAQFQGSYALIRTAILALMAGVHGVTIAWTRGIEIDVSLVAPLLVGALFVVLGSVMGKIRPNWFVGIRTPWTLSSKSTWVRTHRVGGWVFIGCGVMIMAASVISPGVAFAAVIGSTVAASLGLMAYSYFAWRDAPDKSPPAGTLPAE